MTEQPASRRRWFRYSMRSLLVVVTLLCIWLGTVVNRAERQRRTVKALRDLNAQVTYDTPFMNPGGQPSNWRWLRSWIGDDYFDEVTSITLRRGADDALLRQIGQLRAVKLLEVYGHGITDEGLAPIARLPKLEILSLYSRSISDEGVLKLAELKHLRGLWLQAPQVTDRGVIALSQLSDLRQLSLTNVRITNRGLKSLGKLTNLGQLFITSPLADEAESARITDDGLSPITQLSKLERLFLQGTSVTDQGLAELSAIRGLRELDVSCRDPAYTLQGVNELQAQSPFLSVTHSAGAPTSQPAKDELNYPVFHSMAKRRQ